MKKALRWMLAAGFVAVVAQPATLAACAGDCDGGGEVTVDELISAVNIALGSASVDQCAPADLHGDGEVSIDEIVAAMNSALDGCPSPPPRLVVLSREGAIASLDIAAPWTVRASADLRATVGSARCRSGRCLVVHPAADLISIIDAEDLSLLGSIALDHGADPRDIALVDGHAAVVSQYGRAALLEIDLRTHAKTPIDLSALADSDGLPEALKLASCGRRVFVQLRRVDHDSGAPAAIGAALAVIDLDRPAGERVLDADPNAPGLQGIALEGRPNFDMPVDCAGGTLYVAEPAPLMQGGGGYEQVALATLTARDFPIDTSAEVGGFEVLRPDLYWLITHTEFGPGASSHLNLVGGVFPETYNTFAGEHVNDLALDFDEDLLFFPDPCVPKPANPSCDTGVQVFHAHSGGRAAEKGVKVGFEPIEVVVSR